MRSWCKLLRLGRGGLRGLLHLSRVYYSGLLLPYVWPRQLKSDLCGWNLALLPGNTLLPQQLLLHLLLNCHKLLLLQLHPLQALQNYPRALRRLC